MGGYTKLFSSIVTSTVWREAAHVKVVWITMLAIADRAGNVEASVPGLADLARVDRKLCDDALAILSAPDPDSRTKDYDGRRVEVVDGGWRVLNHAKYRDKMSADEKRRRNADYMREYRSRNVVSKILVSQVSGVVHAEADPKAKDRSDQIADPPPAAPKSPAPPAPTDDPAAPVDFVPVVTKYPKSFLDVWERTGRHGSKLKGWKAWTKAKSPPWSALSVSWGLYMRSERAAAGFVKDLSTWLNERGWDQEWTPVGQRPGRAVGSTGRTEPPRCSHHEKSPRFRNPHPVDWCPGCREQVAREGGRTMTTEEILQPPDWMALARGGDT